VTVARVDLGFSPHEHQRAIQAGLAAHSFAVVVAHRRFGKTLLALTALLDRALRCELPAPRLAYVAPRLKQAKQVAWSELRARAMRIPGARAHEAELYVELPGGARITLYGASEGNEEAMRGLYLDGIVIDEVAGMAPHVWGEIIRPALTDRRGWALFIGTPHGMDTFYELWTRAQNDPAWWTALYRVDETGLPWLPEAELELARRSMSATAYRQEFLCDWTASSENVLITIDEIAAACGRSYREHEYAYAPMVLGVDVARFGGDRSAIVARQGLRCFGPWVWQGIDNMALAGRTADLIARLEPQAVFVDAGGGSGVIDRLRQLGHRVSEVQFGGRASDEHYQDKRTEMWWRAKLWIEQGGWLPNEPALKADLSAPTYEYQANGKVRLEQKDKLKERGLPSPDLGDALALTFAHPVAAPGLSRQEVALGTGEMQW
jgi:hypothetical protein